MRMMLGLAVIDFVRLPDDARAPGMVIGGVVVRGETAVVLRGVWAPDVWERWKGHEYFEGPVSIIGDMAQEAPGVVVRVSAIVPLRGFPREQWPEEYRTEEWQPENPPPRDMGAPLPLGTLVRYARRFEYGGALPQEGVAIVGAALRGEVQEPWEQGLSV
jgi:hypothetical protein